MTISLTTLRGFVAVAHSLNFRRAAKELSITQPALSSQIRTLEKTLGARLLTRTTRRVGLTAEGERFLFRTERLIAELEAMIAELRDSGVEVRQSVTLSCIPSIATHVFPRIIFNFKRMNPKVMIQMLDEPTSTMERRILDGEAAFGIGGAPYQSGLDFAPILADPFVVVCERNHHLSQRTCISIDEALEFPIIALAKGSNVRNRIDSYFERVGRAFLPAYEVVHHYTIRGMIESGLGITLMPSHATAMLNESAGLAVVALDDPQFSRTVGLISRKGAKLTPAANTFYTFTAEALTGMRVSSSKGAQYQQPRGLQ